MLRVKVLVHNSIPGTALGRFPVLLSAMQELLDDRHRVIAIECDGLAPSCMTALVKDREACLHCMARAEKGRHLLTPRPARRPMSKYLGARRIAELRAMRDDLTDVDAIKALRDGGADLGYAALSTYSEVRRDPEPDLSDPEIRAIIQNLITTARITYEAWRRALAREKPDRVIMFNGRLAIDRGVLRACQETGVHCRIYEVSSVVDHMTYYDNALPQDIDCVARQIEQLWDDAPADREEVGAAFYRMRRSGASSQVASGSTVQTNDRPYILAQQTGMLPEEWNHAERNIAIFGSSDDEYSAISREWEESTYPSQEEATRAICRDLAAERDTRVYFRMHPRLTGMGRPFIRRILDLAHEHDNLCVLPPESPVCTYAILDACDVAVSFRSTMTLEATFWGKPSLALANSNFSRRGASYDPTTHAEVLDLLRSDLETKDPLAALKYGYYRLRMGFPNRYYRGGDPGKRIDGYTFKDDRIVVDESDLRAYRRRTFGRWSRWM